MKFPALVLCALILLAGCWGAPPAIHEYLLIPAMDQRPRPLRPGALQGFIVLGPVRLAPHLEAGGLVHRFPGGQLHRSATHLWAGPLEAQVAQTLATDLALLLDTNRVVAAPGPRFVQPVLQVDLDLDEFSGLGTTEFLCRLTWTITQVKEKKTLEHHTFQIKVPVDKAGYPGYAAAASQALSAAAGELAAHLRPLLVPSQP